MLFLLLGGFGIDLSAQTWNYNYAAGSGGHDIMESVVTDADGNHYGTGVFRGMVTFGPGYTLTAGNDDVFISKHNPSGSLLWAVKAGSVNADHAYDIAIGPSGFLYITGSFSQTITFQTSAAPITLNAAGQEDIFVAKVNPQNGETIWAVRAGGLAGETGRGLTVLRDGVYVTGEFKGNVSFGAFPLTAVGGIDAFVTRLDTTNGSFQWAFRGRCNGDEFGYDITHDGINLYFTGSFGGDTYILANDTLIDSGTRDIFLAKFTPGGVPTWIRQGGTASGEDAGYAIATSAGKVYVAGSVNTGLVAFLDNTTTGIVGFSTGAGSNTVICRYDASTGNPDWLRTAGFDGNDAFFDISINSSGDLFIGGVFEDSIRFNATTYPGNNEDGIVIQLQPNNTLAAVWTTTGNGDARIYGVAASSCGWVACGNYLSNLGTPPLTLPGAAGLSDIWLAGYFPPGLFPASASVAKDSICLGDSVTLSVGPAGLTGIQWQSGPTPTGPWTNVPGANSLNSTVAPTASTWYRIVSANACGGSSNAVRVVVTGNPVSFTAMAARYCADAPLINLSGSAAPAGTFTCTTTGLSSLGSGTATFNPALAATGTASITYTAPGYCIIPDTQIFVIDTLPTPVISGLASSYCSTVAAQTLSASPGTGGSYTFPGGASLVDLGNGNASFNPSASAIGTALPITFTFTDSHGCVGSTTATTHVTATRTFVLGATPAQVCGDGLPFTVSGSTSPAGVFSGSFSALTPGGPGAATLDPSGMAPGTYTLIYADTGACVIGDTVSITVDPVPVLSLSGLAPSYCASDGPDTLIGNLAPGGTFGPGPGLTDLGNGTASFAPQLAGVGGPYILSYQYTNAQGCSATSTAAVTVLPSTPLSFTPLQSSYCQDQAVLNLIGSAAPLGTFTASTPGLIDLGNGTATFDPSQAGSGPVQIIYTAPGQCTIPDTQATAIDPLPIVTLSATQPSYCTSDSAFTLVGNQAPGGTFTANLSTGWVDNADGTATFTPANATPGASYAITYTYVDGKGCTDADTAVFVVAIPVNYTLAPLPGGICSNAAPLSLQGSTNPAGQFSASPAGGFTDLGNGSALLDPASVTPGSVTIIYGDTGLCTLSDTVQLTVFAAPVAQLQGLDPSYCATSGIDTLIGNYAPAGTITSTASLLSALNGSALLDPAAITAGTAFWLAYSYTDVRGCQDSDTSYFDILPSLYFQLPALPDSICANTGSLAFSGTLAPLGDITGNSPALINLGNGQAAFNPLLAVGQTVQIRYTDGGACSIADSHAIRVLPTPVVTLTGLASNYCSNDAPATGLGSPAGGTFFPLHSGLTVSGPGSITLDPMAAPQGQPYVLYYHYALPNGCQSTDSLSYVVQAHPNFTLGPDQTLCVGDSSSIGLVAVPGYTYAWTASPGGTVANQSAITVNPSVTTSYVLSVSNGSCTAADTLALQMLNPPLVDAGPDLSLCQGDSFMVVGLSNSPIVLWTDANASQVGFGLVMEAVAGASPWYSLSALANGCLAVDTVFVQSTPPPSSAQAGSDLQVNTTAPTLLGAIPPSNGSGTWSSPGGLVFSNPQDPGAQVSSLAVGANLLVWTVSGSSVCPASSDTMLVIVAGQRIPTGFSPNGDGLNDSFEISDLAPGTQLIVFNRWGNEVYADAAYKNDWTGTNASGQPLSDDTYYCVLRYADGRSYAGYVVLRR